MTAFDEAFTLLKIDYGVRSDQDPATENWSLTFDDDVIDELLKCGYRLDDITDDLINDRIDYKNSQDEPDFYIEILLP